MDMDKCSWKSNCIMLKIAFKVIELIAGRTSTDIENSLSSELEQIANWFNDNNLVITLKKSEMKCVLYGTHQKISGVSRFKVKLQGRKIPVSMFYNYLGVIMDKGLTQRTHWDSSKKDILKS